jgi:hypothetical protein
VTTPSERESFFKSYFFSGSDAPQAEPHDDGAGSAAPQADVAGSDVPHDDDSAPKHTTFFNVSLI